MADDQPVLVDRSVEHVAVLTLNRPEALNPIGRGIPQRLTQLWAELDEDPSVRVVVVTGAGRGFCSGAEMGADRGSHPDGAPSDWEEHRDSFERRGLPGYPGPGGSAYPRWTPRSARFYKPVIAAVNGVCAGAGLHFVADCNIIICNESASFVDTHVNVGQVTAMEPVGLSRIIPLNAVFRMVCMGKYERVTAQRAYELGLVSEVVADDKLLDRAIELSGFIAKASPQTLQTSLRAIWEGLDYGLTQAYDRAFLHVSAHWPHPDAREGPRAFAEKRDPNWAAGDQTAGDPTTT
jgi:enoyl-CoA hydratase/carnithine racemase